MNKLFVSILGISLLFIIQCRESSDIEIPIEAKFTAFCGSCHLTPEPNHITKDLWKNNVLPEMAARLGYRYNDYDPLARNSMEENLYVKRSNIYPEQAGIDSLSFRQIHDYIIELAPEVIPLDSSRSTRNSLLTLFEPHKVKFDSNRIPRITCVQFQKENYRFVVGNAYGQVHYWPDSSTLDVNFASPVTSYGNIQDDLILTEVGYLNPSEIPLGGVYRKNKEAIDTLAQKVHRPVWTEIIDLNDDGIDEILICEYGNLTGELSILTKSISGYKKRTLLPVPGSIKVEIVDMDNDGRSDILVLAAQGNEGLYILYQKTDLTFSISQVIKLGPEYGSSWFEALDYDNDNDLDIVMVNGDNADFSIFSKPYHGIRLFLNDGSNSFLESWFYPIYGATRVLSHDYDMDGDIDFAVMSFFPDFGIAPEESFVYLENQDAKNYIFKSHTFQRTPVGRWLVMDKGDVDEDGDVDIMLGSFLLPPGKNHRNILDTWMEENVDVMILENKANNKPE